MVQPTSVKNTQNQSIVTLTDATAASFVELAVGDVDVGLTPHAAWKGVATHKDGDAIVAADGVVVVAGSNGGVAVKELVDASGRQVVVGAAVDGAAVLGNPVLVGGQDGTNAQSLLVDSSGRPIVVGAAADGAAVAGNPVLMAGQDGANAQSILTDSSGRLIVVTVPTPGALTDRSGAITVGGASQVLAAALATRKYLLIQNLHASEDLWINFTTAAVADKPSVRIVAGSAFLMDGAFVTNEAVNVIAATTGHKFAAKEG